MNIYISSSWKNRIQVREMAVKLREMGHEVYDFTDPNCRKTPEIPPEKFPEEFDPEKHIYSKYIVRREWQDAIIENRHAIHRADFIILLLPCGNDSHADWAYGVGMGIANVVVGQPRKGERSPVHMWSDKILDTISQLYEYVQEVTK
jgi:hypothetical protein